MNGTSLPQVHLRAIEPEDLDMLYRIENDVRLWDVSTTNVPYSRYLLHEYVANSTGDIYTDKQVRLIIEDQAGNTVGIADLSDFDPRHNRAEIGLVIEQHYRHQGYAQAAVIQLHHYAFHVLHLHQLYAIIAVANEATLDIFRMMNYRQTAILKDWLFDGQAYADAAVMQICKDIRNEATQ